MSKKRNADRIPEIRPSWTPIDEPQTHASDTQNKLPPRIASTLQESGHVVEELSALLTLAQEAFAALNEVDNRLSSLTFRSRD